jgi:hypothetical protein
MFRRGEAFKSLIQYYGTGESVVFTESNCFDTPGDLLLCLGTVRELDLQSLS